MNFIAEIYSAKLRKIQVAEGGPGSGRTGKGSSEVHHSKIKEGDKVKHNGKVMKVYAKGKKGITLKDSKGKLHSATGRKFFTKT